MLLSDSSRDYPPPLPFAILPSWTSIAPSSARASGGTLVAVRGHVRAPRAPRGPHALVSRRAQGFDLSAAFVCVFTSDNGVAVTSKVTPSQPSCRLVRNRHSQPALAATPSQLSCMSATRPAPPLQTRLEHLTLLCSVPQRDTAATRNARFSLSMNGLEVFGSTSVANFIFTESISAVQPSVPAHAIVFDVSGYGQHRATARFICHSALIVCPGFVPSAAYTAAILPSLQLPPAASASCTRLRPTALRCSVRFFFRITPFFYALCLFSRSVYAAAFRCRRTRSLYRHQV